MSKGPKWAGRQHQTKVRELIRLFVGTNRGFAKGFKESAALAP